MIPLLNLLSILGIASNFGILALQWSSIPETVPVHFNFHGAPDRWGSRGTLMALPIVSLLSYVVVSAAVKLGKARNSMVALTEENTERQRAVMLRMTAWINAEVAWMFTFIEWRTIEAAMGRVAGLGWQFLPITMVAIFGTTGYYLWRSYQLR